MPGNSNISNVSRKKRSFDNNILKRRNHGNRRKTTQSYRRICTRSRTGQRWPSAKERNIKGDESEKQPLHLARMKSFSINWLSRTHSTQNVLHIIFQNNDDNLSNRSILKDYHMQLTHITILLYISLFLFKENYYCVYLICKLFRSISKRLLITHGNIWITNVKDLLEQISPKCGLVYFIILTQKLLSCKLGKNDKYIITFFVKIFYWFWCHLKKKSTFITISRFAVRQLAANSYMLIQVWCIHLPYCFKNLHSFAPLEG